MVTLILAGCCWVREHLLRRAAEGYRDYVDDLNADLRGERDEAVDQLRKINRRTATAIDKTITALDQARKTIQEVERTLVDPQPQPERNRTDDHKNASRSYEITRPPGDRSKRNTTAETARA